MKKIFFDCSFGINGYMALTALKGLGVPEEQLEEQGRKIDESIHEYAHRHEEHHEHHHEHHHGDHEEEHHHEHHGRGYVEIREIIETAGLPLKVTKYAISIYETIAEAEAQVHGATVDTVHFHEVGRDEAISNIVKTAFCVYYLEAEEFYCGIVHDGCGFVDCSHGRIPVPVPAVEAMMDSCQLVFEEENIEREMVTPSGLAILIGLGTVYTEGMPSGEVQSRSFAPALGAEQGQGLRVMLIED